jgi:hypothetical protein
MKVIFLNDVLTNLMATCHIRYRRVNIWYALRSLLSIQIDRASPQDILLFYPSDWYGVVRALSILVPCLGYCMRCNVGVTILTFRMVRRLHLKGDGVVHRSLISGVSIHVHPTLLQRDEPVWYGSAREDDRMQAVWKWAHNLSYLHPGSVNF